MSFITMKKSLVFKMLNFFSSSYIYETFFVCDCYHFINCGIYEHIFVAFVKCYGGNGNYHVFVSFYGVHPFTLVMSDSVTELDNYRSFHNVVKHFRSLYDVFEW